jgi:endonuclease G
VASIAAGRPVGAFPGGVAPEARLLVVISAAQGPIGYSQSHLDALAFVDRVATQLAMPVVVNVSQGKNAGAHDGKSLLEVGFDMFSEGGRKPGRVVVKSAGNERQKGGHARVTLGPGMQEELRWQRDPQGSVDERLELWWDSADLFAFRIGDPQGSWSGWADASHTEESGTSSGGSYRLTHQRRHVDNGDSLLAIELDGAGAQAWWGSWRLQIRSVDVRGPGEIHAWIERTPDVPSSFVSHGSEDLTLSIPGTAQNVISVGAVDAATPVQVGAFSSYGPTRDGRCKPEVAAPGVRVRAAKGGTDDQVLFMDGTSMAAPHVAGAIALVLSRSARLGAPIPTSTQIAAAIRQKTQYNNARWDRGPGYGVIDVAALLAAF